MKLCFSVTLAQRQDFHYREKKMHTVYFVGVSDTESVPRIVSVPPPHSSAVVDKAFNQYTPIRSHSAASALISMVTSSAKCRADLPLAFSTLQSVINSCPVHGC